jgi:hypothetical protein
VKKRKRKKRREGDRDRDKKNRRRRGETAMDVGGALVSIPVVHLVQTLPES